MDLTPIKDWFASDESITAIVGDRISTKGLRDRALPALLIACTHGDDPADTRSVIQFDLWTEGENAKALAEKSRPVVINRIKAMPSDLFSTVEIIRDNLLGHAPAFGYGERRRLSIDALVTREVVEQ